MHMNKMNAGIFWNMLQNYMQKTKYISSLVHIILMKFMNVYNEFLSMIYSKKLHYSNNKRLTQMWLI